MNIGFNINPTVYGKGAANFLHCKSLGRWTSAGCVTIPENYMLDLLRKSHNGEWIIIVRMLTKLQTTEFNPKFRREYP